MKTIAKLNTISIIFLIGINFYENSGDPLSGISGEGNDVYHSLQKWIYISSALYLLIKLCFVSLILYAALYLTENPVAFQKVFLISTVSESVFFIPAALKIAWFHYYYPEGTLNDWHKMYLFSALSILKTSPADWSYALQTLNLFEFAYWFLLAYGIYKFAGITYDQSLRIVIYAYVPALFIWVAAITFVTLVMFPAMG
jgi:hypothetical protein